MSDEVRARLRCPRCHSPLAAFDLQATAVACPAATCAALYPIVDGIPVLIDERCSVFALQDFVQNRVTTLLRARPSLINRCGDRIFGETRFKEIKRRVRSCLPSIDRNLASARNFGRLASLLGAQPRPRVLILGGGIVGDGMDVLLRHRDFEFVETDVSFGPRTKLICDGHDIPFADGTFDAVIVQAVLEHVADAPRCVEEIHRVLKADGYVYAETPFMQQVHAGRYDFTRYTHLGHRRLFRNFHEVESGIVCGPGMALAWAYRYFLLSFVSGRFGRSVMRNVSAITSFPLKYLDGWLARRPGSYDAASGFYLLAQRSTATIPDGEILAQYRGRDSM